MSNSSKSKDEKIVIYHNEKEESNSENNNKDNANKDNIKKEDNSNFSYTLFGPLLIVSNCRGKKKK